MLISFAQFGTRLGTELVLVNADDAAMLAFVPPVPVRITREIGGCFMLRSTLVALLVASPFIVLTGRTPATSPNDRTNVARASPGPATFTMARRYRVHLTRTWPQLRGVDGCVNGGAESLDGLLGGDVGGTDSGRRSGSSRP